MGLLAHTALQAAQPPTTRSGWIRQAEETVSSSSGATAPPTPAAGDRLIGEEWEKPGAPSSLLRGAARRLWAILAGGEAEGRHCVRPRRSRETVASPCLALLTRMEQVIDSGGTSHRSAHAPGTAAWPAAWKSAAIQGH
ncbi:hypothetical protein TRIUR3_13660 [Triticum urartu]|uniref:Uncharacterized protein n=1 Tax=Triticum urartu TaxID=4572 RepID=M7ZZI1_TRIUA|nr:hypothetical protein TRIUR3_13660 [Triticum urartu]